MYICVHTEATDNQPDRGTLGHCLLYIPLRPETHSETLSTVHSESIDNQSDRGHTLGHTGAVNCMYTQRAHTMGLPIEL